MIRGQGGPRRDRASSASRYRSAGSSSGPGSIIRPPNRTSSPRSVHSIIRSGSLTGRGSSRRPRARRAKGWKNSPGSMPPRTDVATVGWGNAWDPRKSGQLEWNVREKRHNSTKSKVGRLGKLGFIVRRPMPVTQHSLGSVSNLHSVVNGRQPTTLV